MAVPEANSQHDADRVPLGQLLVDSGLLDAADLERVLEEQRRTGAPLGRMLVDGGYLASSTIAMALADQHGGLLKTEYGFATGSGLGAQRPSARTDRRCAPRRLAVPARRRGADGFAPAAPPGERACACFGAARDAPTRPRARASGSTRRRPGTAARRRFGARPSPRR